MREVDRIAVEEFGLGILQMMENAGRNLADNLLTMLDGAKAEITILAGSGGNGGGGLCCARHLHNRGFKVWVVIDREQAELTTAARNQLQILRAAGVPPMDASHARDFLRRSQVVVDALIGYGLRGTPQGRTAELIDLCNDRGRRILSLDVPSGLNATTGDAPGPVVRPDRTLTLALPKTGLHSLPGDLYLGDIGIPPEVFHRLGLSFEPPFKKSHWVRLVSTPEGNHPGLDGAAD
ncbi:MAG: NAD(P)H-hydrate epimerase [Chloroflexi bacterium B3_Chlor]|nr:MAG: NAD(P)H-hydrate epimerase [Chloroflexi bacterium B3_Chlor]